MHRSFVSHQIWYDPFIDKLLIWLFCTVIYYRFLPNQYAITYILLSLAMSCFYTLVNQPLFRHCLLILFSLISVVDSLFLVFLPLFAYDIYRHYPVWLLISTGAISIIMIPYANYRFEIVCMTILAIALKHKSDVLSLMHRESISLRDRNKEFMMQLEEKNFELMQKQDYEINLATLNERNRIAREIHDNVGHQLTRAILQVGAIQYMPMEESLRHQLIQVKQSLDESMNSIRSSVHQLYDDSIDLRFEIEKMVKSFTFCRIHYQYQINCILSQKEKFALLAIIKEALTNITKHSNAKQCSIKLKEHPGFLQLKISDDGTNISPHATDQGIGLQSIAERVQQLSGYFKIKTDSGFQIFITIPKEEQHESRID